MGKILFIRGGAVGDFILTMPAMKLVRESLPHTWIEVLGYPGIANLALVTGIADRLRSIEDARLATFFIPGAKLDSEWSTYFAEFDVVVSFLYDPDGYFAANLKVAGVKTLIACPYRPVQDPPHVPAAIQFAKPLEQLALFLDEPALELDYPLAGDIFEDDARPLIALHPGSGSPSKNWSFEAWRDVLAGLQQRHPDARLLITSGEAESGVISQFLGLLDESQVPHSHLGGRNLVELGGIYRQVDYFLGHDSGISHLAASAGASGLLLFGPTNPAIWAPVSSRVRTLRSANGSLAEIRPDEVLNAIDPASYSRPLRR